MFWNWQQKDWPQFTYQEALLTEIETNFLYKAGVLYGSYLYINEQDKTTLTIDSLSSEALKTSEIEGEYLNRDSLQSSIRRYFGLKTDVRKIEPAEQGIAEMMVNLYQTFSNSLTHETLFAWHAMLTCGRHDLRNIGQYRTHVEPMQVVSGPLYKPKVHFEAPPSNQVKREMDRYVKWFNDTAPDGKTPLSTLTRAGISHLFFVSIHPFEDGNGRIGRAIVKKALSQSLGQATLIALSHTIQKHKKAYYDNLEKNNKINEITNWLIYFSKTIMEAQDYTQKLIHFLVEKTKWYDNVRGKINLRQEKVITRLFQEGPEGFKGGLSAENYIVITRTSRATATRDLQDLVDQNLLYRTGERKSTRYYLTLFG